VRDLSQEEGPSKVNQFMSFDKCKERQQQMDVAGMNRNVGKKKIQYFRKIIKKVMKGDGRGGGGKRQTTGY